MFRTNILALITLDLGQGVVNARQVSENRASRRDRVMCCRKRAGESSVYRTVCWMLLCPR
jgi:hypothetical protein